MSWGGLGRIKAAYRTGRLTSIALAAVGSSALFLSFVATARSAPTTITEFSAGLADGGLADDLTAGPDGNFWFDVIADDVPAVGRITSNGKISEFNEGFGPGVPRGIIPGADSNLWFGVAAFGGSNIAIGRITPAGTVTGFSGLTVKDDPERLAVGPEGNVWFTYGGGPSPGVGRITPSGAISQFDLPAGPDTIVAGADGNMWFTYGEGESSAIGRIESPDEGGGTTIALFHAGLSKNSRPGDIALGPDGNLWFIDFPRSAIGRVVPDGTITEFTDGVGSSLRNIVAGPDGNMWFSDWAGVGRIEPDGAATEFIFPGVGRGRTVQRIVSGPDGNIWFTAMGQLGDGSVGRVTPSGAITEFSKGLSTGSQPSGIAVGVDSNLWFTDWGSVPAVGRITPGDDGEDAGASPTLTKSVSVGRGRPGRVKLGRHAIRVRASGVADLGLFCAGGVRCAGRVTLTEASRRDDKGRRSDGKVLGTRSFSVVGATRTQVEFKLNERGRRLMRESRQVPALLSFFGSPSNLADPQRVNVRLIRVS